jgi:hypothetical protein
MRRSKSAILRYVPKDRQKSPPCARLAGPIKAAALMAKSGRRRLRHLTRRGLRRACRYECAFDPADWLEARDENPMLRLHRTGDADLRHGSIKCFVSRPQRGLLLRAAFGDDSPATRGTLERWPRLKPGTARRSQQPDRRMQVLHPSLSKRRLRPPARTCTTARPFRHPLLNFSGLVLQGRPFFSLRRGRTASRRQKGNQSRRL